MDAETRTRVAEGMSTPPETVAPETSARETASAMRERDINSLVVTTDPPSIVTSTDVVDAVADGRDSAELDVSEVMTESVETIPLPCTSRRPPRWRRPSASTACLSSRAATTSE